MMIKLLAVRGVRDEGFASPDRCTRGRVRYVVGRPFRSACPKRKYMDSTGRINVEGEDAVHVVHVQRRR